VVFRVAVSSWARVVVVVAMEVVVVELIMSNFISAKALL
jgi:hypothetical protein